LLSANAYWSQTRAISFFFLFVGDAILRGGGDERVLADGQPWA
jgi:hypothetical protein